jgi:hypothetical protein
MQVNEHGLYTEPTYIQGGYKQSLRVQGEPWGYGALTVQPGTYQLDAGGMVPTTTLGAFSPVITGGGIVYMGIGAGMAWAAWKVAAQAFGGKQAPNWAAGLVGMLGVLGGVGMMLGGGAATAIGAGAR